MKVFLVFLLCFSFGCQRGSKNDQNIFDPQSLLTQGSGAWSSECLDKLGQGFVYGFTAYQDGTIEYFQNFFKTNACDALIFQIKKRGALAAKTSSTFGKGVFELDIKILEGLVTYYEDDGFPKEHFKEICGDPERPWSIGESRKCIDDQSIFSVARIDGNKLFLGEQKAGTPNNGATTQLRHNQISQAFLSRN